MTRSTWVYRDGKMVKRPLARNHSGGVMIISDALPDLVHPADGKRYSSKSRFRAETKAHGLVEFGNERQTRRTPEMPDPAPAVKQAIERLRAGYRPQAQRAEIPRGEFGPIRIDRVRDA